MRRLLVIALPLLLAAACANPEETPPSMPDSGVVDSGMVEPPRDGGIEEPPRDGGVIEEMRGLKLKSSNLAPSTGRASSPTRTLNGRFGATGPARSTSGSFKLRGGIVPGGTQTSSIAN